MIPRKISYQMKTAIVRVRVENMLDSHSDLPSLSQEEERGESMLETLE